MFLSPFAASNATFALNWAVYFFPILPMMIPSFIYCRDEFYNMSKNWGSPQYEKLLKVLSLGVD